jgi:hypothetical protein
VAKASTTRHRIRLRRVTDHDHTGREPDPYRPANALDRYSLLLQLIQVFPIVTQAALLMVVTSWLAPALSGLCLLFGTVWVIYVERIRTTRTTNRHDAHNLLPRADSIQLVESQARGLAVGSENVTGQDDPMLHTEVTHQDGKVNISISLHLRPPDPHPGRARRDVRDIAIRRHVRHRSTPTKPSSLEQKDNGDADSKDGATVVA